MERDLRYLADEHKLSKTERKVLFYLAETGADVLDANVRDVATANGTSAGTVMRLAKKMGYRGFTDMCYHLERDFEFDGENSAEDENPLSQVIQLPEEDRAALKTIARRLRRTHGDIHLFGSGFSSIVSSYLAKKFSRFALHAHITDGDNSVIDFENIVEAGDTAFLVSRSGRTERGLQYAKVAKASGVYVITITADTENPLRDMADTELIVHDDRPLDNRNALPSSFFPACIMLVEMLAAEYLQLEQEA